MRYLILLSFMISLMAVEPIREDFVLTDGRKLTGIYNEDKQLLTLDGGKMSLTIAPEQIATRKDHDILADGDVKSAKVMTPEEKAKAVEGYKAGQKEAALNALIVQADRADKESVQLLAKAKAWRDKAKVAAESFRKRALAEGDDWSVEAILRGGLVTQRTHANNGAIVGMMKDALRFEQESGEKKQLAKEKRKEAGVSKPADNAGQAGEFVPPQRPMPVRPNTRP